MRYTSGVALLRVCRQIHSETWSLPLSRHTFFIVRHPDEARFFNTISDAQKAAITSIKLEFVCYHDPDWPDFDKLWFWDLDVHDNFHTHHFDILDTLTGLKTVHLNVSIQWLDGLVLAEHFQQAEAMVETLEHDLQRRVGDNVVIVVHRPLWAERNYDCAQDG